MASELIASQPIPAPVSETGAVLHMIERAARDPSVDIEKLTRLLELRARIEEQNAKRDFTAAMALAQAEMRPVAADCSNPSTKSRYASLVALDKAIRPIYTRHGLYPSFNTEAAGPDSILVTCDVEHAGGHSRRYSIPMPADGKGARGNDVMTKTHATGSAVTYGRRYLLLMIFNLVVGDDDDDGNGGGAAGEYITAAQVAELKKLIEDGGGNVERFCSHAQVASLADIYSGRFEAAKAFVRNANAARARKARG